MRDRLANALMGFIAAAIKAIEEKLKEMLDTLRACPQGRAQAERSMKDRSANALVAAHAAAIKAAEEKVKETLDTLRYAAESCANARKLLADEGKAGRDGDQASRPTAPPPRRIG